MHLYIIQIEGGEINNTSPEANLLNNEVPLSCFCRKQQRRGIMMWHDDKTLEESEADRHMDVK